jgi:hypothetical protein
MEVVGFWGDKMTGRQSMVNHRLWILHGLSVYGKDGGQKKIPIQLMLQRL